MKDARYTLEVTIGSADGMDVGNEKREESKLIPRSLSRATK